MPYPSCFSRVRGLSFGGWAGGRPYARRDDFDLSFFGCRDGEKENHAGGRALTRRDEFDFVFFRGWPILCGFLQRVGHSGWGGRPSFAPLFHANSGSLFSGSVLSTHCPLFTTHWRAGAPSSGFEGGVLGLDFLFRKRNIQSYLRYLPAIQRLTPIFFFCGFSLTID